MPTELLDKVRRSPSFLSWSPGPKSAESYTITVGRGRSFEYVGKTYTNLGKTYTNLLDDKKYIGKTHTNLIVDEKHYSPADLAKAWSFDVETVRNIFRDEPGVLKIGEKNPLHKRSYLTLRIPESVAVRVHKRLSE